MNRLKDMRRDQIQWLLLVDVGLTFPVYKAAKKGKCGVAITVLDEEREDSGSNTQSNVTIH